MGRSARTALLQFPKQTEGVRACLLLQEAGCTEDRVALSPLQRPGKVTGATGRCQWGPYILWVSWPVWLQDMVSERLKGGLHPHPPHLEWTCRNRSFSPKGLAQVTTSIL